MITPTGITAFIIISVNLGGLSGVLVVKFVLLSGIDEVFIKKVAFVIDSLVVDVPILFVAFVPISVISFAVFVDSCVVVLVVKDSTNTLSVKSTP